MTTMANNIQVPVDLTPSKGMLFKTENEAYEFYRKFGARRGFSVRKQGGKKDRASRSYVYYKYVCSKEGMEKPKIETGNHMKSLLYKKRRTTIKRTGCYARMSITRRNEGLWEVTHFEDEHNHELVPEGSVHFLRSQRRVTIEKRILPSHYTKLNVRPSMQYRILDSQYGCNFANVGCTPKDLQNSRRTQRQQLAGHDAGMFLVYLEAKKKKNSDFFYVVKRDEENTFRGCFWSDAKSRKAYNYFGDCVVMDATYKTNKYNMIFATIAGVNHHRQTIVFGCALLGDEKVETYKWMLETWLEAMPASKAPNVIITDQDAALRNAITEILPTTFHRYCIWHILYKFDKKLTPSEMKDYYTYFKDSIKNSRTNDEFESSWKLAMDTSGLVENSWLNELYAIRESWVPAFCNKYFSAGMSSSQRVESSHSFFKKYFSNQNTLIDFITKFDMALRYQRENELRSDFEEINEEPKLETLYQIEREMSKVYTRSNFRKLQDELYKSQAFLLLIKQEETEAHELHSICAGEGPHGNICIRYEKGTNFAHCSCRKWDFEGVPCCHILFFYRSKGMANLPSQYVLQRWTRNATAKRVWDKDVELNDNPNKDVLMRHMRVSKLCQELAEKACLSVDSTDVVLKEIEKLMENVQKMNVEHGITDMEAANKIQVPEEGTVKDPDPVRTKGSGVGGRYKRKREMTAGKQTRLCQECFKQGHNVRTCPLLRERQGFKHKRNTTDESESDPCEDTV